MKKVILLSLLLSIIVSSNIAFAQSATESTAKKDSVYYTCPMHPEIKSDKPGNCPKCGMALVKTSASDKQSKKHSMKMNCPMMGGMGDMNSSPANQNTTDKQELNKNVSDSTMQSASVYACPMHADVTSDKPSYCPKCGMALEKKSK